MPKMAAYERVVLSTYCLEGQPHANGATAEKDRERAYTYVEEVADSEEWQDAPVKFPNQFPLGFTIDVVVVRISRNCFEVELRVLLVNLIRHDGFDILFLVLSAAHALDIGRRGHDLLLVQHVDGGGTPYLWLSSG